MLEKCRGWAAFECESPVAALEPETSCVRISTHVCLASRRLCSGGRCERRLLESRFMCPTDSCARSRVLPIFCRPWRRCGFRVLRNQFLSCHVNGIRCGDAEADSLTV